jgi:hypothetical protein
MASINERSWSYFMSDVKTMTIEDAGRLYFGVGRAGAYLAAKRGDLPLVGRGKRKRVSVPAMERILLEAGKQDADGKQRDCAE